MRKLIVGEFVSLDGVVETPEAWHFPYVNEEVMGVLASLSTEVDTMLLGGVTYQSYAGAFANAPDDDPVAVQMNNPAKVVVSQTLGDLGWKNSTLLAGTGDVAGQITGLKQHPGGTILTTGSITLVQTLLRAGLVDELNLLVHPIVVGVGRRLFQDDGPQIPLKLAACTTFTTGVTHQIYHKA